MYGLLMRRLGVVENIAYNGDLVVRASYAPHRGQRIVDRRGRPLGRVKRAFGPVKEPFVAVQPFNQAPLALMGTEVYVKQERGGHAQEKD